MDAILTTDQEELLKRTRDVLGQLRDVLGTTAVSTQDFAPLSESIRQLDELFLLVITGEFNAGKSAFINALMGQPLLTEGVTPTTSQIYLLRYGDKTEQKPIEKGVWLQTAPIELLRQISIVDTPGTNAILREHEALTAEFIPRSDLVIFITSADRPFTESERSFLAQIRDWGKKIVLVINKIDILTNDADREQVINFVTESARQLVGEISGVFPVSGKMAQQAKAGQPQLWDGSGFAPMEAFIHDTLDDNGRFQLKLLNPLGVGHKLVKHQLQYIEADLNSLKDDTTLLSDIEGQMTYYNEDMQRNFKARLGEIDNLIHSMEKRGDDFFDEMMRMGRIPDLLRNKKIEEAFEAQVIADTPQKIELRVSELVDWMVEQDLRQWTAVADHLATRKDDYQNRVVGRSGQVEGTLAYDRQRLIDSIGTATRTAVETYDRDQEAHAIAQSARQAVVNTGLAGVGVGLGVAVAAAAQLVWLDVTGVVAGVTAALIGLLILPTRRRRARNDLHEKLDDLRRRLMHNLTEQFDREMRRSSQRIEDVIAPFGRFVRAEQDKIGAQHKSMVELEAHIVGLLAQLKG